DRERCGEGGRTATRSSWAVARQVRVVVISWIRFDRQGDWIGVGRVDRVICTLDVHLDVEGRTGAVVVDVLDHELAARGCVDGGRQGRRIVGRGGVPGGVEGPGSRSRG